MEKIRVKWFENAWHKYILNKRLEKQIKILIIIIKGENYFINQPAKDTKIRINWIR